MRRLILFRRLDDALKLFRSLGPYERYGIFVVAGNEGQQEFLELVFGAVNTLRQTLLAQDAEETFH